MRLFLILSVYPKIRIFFGGIILLMMLFFQPDWAGAYWGRRAGDRTATGLVCKLWMCLFSAKKNKKEEGPTGASSVAAPMPKSVPR